MCPPDRVGQDGRIDEADEQCELREKMDRLDPTEQDRTRQDRTGGETRHTLGSGMPGVSCFPRFSRRTGGACVSCGTWETNRA